MRRDGTASRLLLITRHFPLITEMIFSQRDAPRAFRARLAEHNRIAWACAGFSLAGAALAWLVFYGVIAGGALLLATVIHGEDTRMPREVPMIVLGAGLVLCLWSAIARWRSRFRPLNDRSIVGWHLLKETLLLPPRMTFAIKDHLDARIALSRSERRDAWHLLVTISDMGRANNSALSYDFPNPHRLAKLLMALQFSGWIDLHRGNEDWFYVVRSLEQKDLRKLKLAAESTVEELGKGSI